MRIAILTNAYPPRTHGGCGRIAFIYADLLKARGHEVKVWGPQVWFYRLAKMPALFRLYFHLRDLGSQDKTIKEISDWKPDALLTHNLTGCGFATPKNIRDAGVRWVHVLHDVQLFEPSGQVIFGEGQKVWRRMWRRIWAGLRRRSLGEPDAVASPTAWLLGEHRKFGFFGRAKTAVVPNPLGEVVAVAGDGARDPRAIAFVGRLDPDKGIDILLNAWRRIRHAATGLRLFGDGRRRGAVEELGDPKVQTGELEHGRLMQALRSCGVCAVPSLVMENQPTVILEALASGCRVVATDVGGVAETLGEAGWLVRPGSVDDLVQALLQAMEPGERPELERARREILALHEPEACVSRLEGLLKSNL